MVGDGPRNSKFWQKGGATDRAFPPWSNIGSRAPLDCGKKSRGRRLIGGAEQATGSEILRAEHETAPTLSAEVEFALVVSRMIDSVKSDPEHLRATVYELARHKL
jgi:hypothetical protein